ncbi:DUF4974 domain-containing protein [Sphingobacterium sp. DK4209]|uniref:DUF4974 domain-containing protein n=1 Tax=Sphingobacterium zhuxiongii TaxID=2662364 RepID=A0A5Q0Q923_9SPHI|nr:MULTISPECIES: FecR family protein [unclassified Sphingobacterium]MVZ66158.1 DUF4974 domain-containing protein [Sphingobacterium sp. DK4209]QGA26577.1 DUF4974 domain-containing protein [Sphingobacterium sp. dk4302]
MSLNREKIESLAAKLLQGDISAQELNQLNQWINDRLTKAPHAEQVDDLHQSDHVKLKMLHNIRTRIDSKPTKQKPWKNYLWFIAALAASLLMVMYFNTTPITEKPAVRQEVLEPELTMQADTVYPVTGAAYLTLSDGRQIPLEKAQSALILRDGQLLYADGTQALESAKAITPGVVTLNTPAGSRFSLTLSDGTKVWLNANSSISYPLNFAGNYRQVSLTGEAYFEVHKNAKQPFQVKIESGMIQVLGTAFNISAYTDKKIKKTTVIEGAVRVAQDGKNQPETLVLKPNEQALMSNESIRKQQVDAQATIAWKDGLFYFDSISAHEAFSQLADWYDLNILYEGNLSDISFYGVIDRHKSLGAILKILERSGVKFKLYQQAGRKTLKIIKT